METVERFLVTLQGKKVIKKMEGRVQWKEAKDGLFSVKSFYSILEGSNIVAFPYNIIWSSYVPPKVGFFAWGASWDKVLTLDQLKKREWSLLNRCFLCCDAEETIDHFLIHCFKSKVLWDFLFILFSVLWILLLLVKEVHFGRHGSFVGKKRKRVWRASPMCLFWMVWKERNKIAFESDKFSIQRLKFSFVSNFWSWAKSCIVEEPQSLINFFDWLGSS